jgi:hypothetical protein
MKSGFAIDAIAFVVKLVTKWITAMIVGKLFVPPAQICFLVNFVGVDYVTIALQPVDGTFPSCLKFLVWLDGWLCCGGTCCDAFASRGI